MIQCGENLDFISDSVYLISLKLGFIEQFNGDLKGWISYIMAQKYFSKLSSA
jgi:hypothetical protein